MQQENYEQQVGSEQQEGSAKIEEEQKAGYVPRENLVATIFGLIFFPFFVIFAYRLNTYFLKKEPLTGGRLFWRYIGWGILTAIPLVGLIYGLIKLGAISKTRKAIRYM